MIYRDHQLDRVHFQQGENSACIIEASIPHIIEAKSRPAETSP